MLECILYEYKGNSLVQRINKRLENIRPILCITDDHLLWFQWLAYIPYYSRQVLRISHPKPLGFYDYVVERLTFTRRKSIFPYGIGLTFFLALALSYSLFQFITFPNIGVIICGTTGKFHISFGTRFYQHMCVLTTNFLSARRKTH